MTTDAKVCPATTRRGDSIRQGTKATNSSDRDGDIVVVGSR